MDFYEFCSKVRGQPPLWIISQLPKNFSFNYKLVWLISGRSPSPIVFLFMEPILFSIFLDIQISWIHLQFHLSHFVTHLLTRLYCYDDYYYVDWMFYVMKIIPKRLPKAQRAPSMSAFIKVTAFKSYHKLLKNHKVIKISTKPTSWPRIQFKVLTNIQLRNLESRFLTKLQLQNLYQTWVRKKSN